MEHAPAGCHRPFALAAIWINSEKFGNFKDAGGQSAVPYLLVFETKPAK